MGGPGVAGECVGQGGGRGWPPGRQRWWRGDGWRLIVVGGRAAPPPPNPPPPHAQVDLMKQPLVSAATEVAAAEQPEGGEVSVGPQSRSESKQTLALEGQALNSTRAQ